MGHSWGSFIGLQAAARAPELFHSYIGMAQATHQIASEQEAYRSCSRVTARAATIGWSAGSSAPRSPVTFPFPAATRSCATLPCTVSGSAPPTTWDR